MDSVVNSYSAALHVEEVVDRILSYLPVVDLLTKKSVCVFWKQAVERVLRQRRRSPCIEHNVLTADGCPDACKNESGSSRRRKRAKLQNKKQYLEKFKESFIEWKNCWHQVPRIIILFCKSNKAAAKSFAKYTDEIYELFRNHLPENSAIIMIKGPMCRQLSEFDLFLQTEALALSSVPNSCINIMSWQTLKTNNNKQCLLDAIKHFTLCQKDLRMLLFFYDITSQGNIRSWMEKKFCPFLQKDMEISSNTVVLGCAVHDKIKFSNNSLNCMSSLIGSELKGIEYKLESFEHSEVGKFFALAINGSSLFSASVLLDHTVDTASELHNKLKSLQDSVDKSVGNKLNTHNSFGIMISCIDRMHDTLWYEDLEATEKGIERSAFQAAFPSVPILAMHGFGEVGSNFNLNDCSPSKCEELFHTGATVFSVVSLL